MKTLSSTTVGAMLAIFGFTANATPILAAPSVNFKVVERTEVRDLMERAMNSSE